MQKLLSWMDTILVALSIGLIRIYQYTLSPDRWFLRYRLHGRVCAHEPHCSAYAVLSLQRYGFLHWWSLALRRIYHCRPAHQITYDPPVLRVVFFGSAAIGIPFLEQLLHDPRYEVVGVVTVPEQPIGRGMHLQKNIIARWLEEKAYQIPIFTPRTLREDHKTHRDDAIFVTEQLTHLRPDIFVVIAYGKILPASVLSIPRLGPINVHGSLLPAYRGATPLQSVFLDAQNTSGITIMLMDEGLDTGPILAQLTIPLPFTWTVADLIEACKMQWPTLLADTVWQWKQGTIIPKPQSSSSTAVCHKLTKEDGLFDPLVLPLSEVYARWRAFFLWPKLHFFVWDKRITIEHIVLDLTEYQRSQHMPLFSATYALHPAVISLRVTPAGKKTMERKAFLNGLSISSFT